jgi:hypothetical protein
MRTLWGRYRNRRVVWRAAGQWAAGQLGSWAAGQWAAGQLGSWAAGQLGSWAAFNPLDSLVRGVNFSTDIS